MAQIIANISAYFCSTEGVIEAITCGVDEVVPANTTFGDALPLIVAYFCTQMNNLSVDHITSVTTTPIGAPDVTTVTLWADVAETINLGSFDVSDGAEGSNWVIPVKNIVVSGGATHTEADDQGNNNKIVVFEDTVPPAVAPSNIVFVTPLGAAEGDIVEIINYEGNANIKLQPNTATASIGTWSSLGNIKALGTGQVILFSTGTASTGGLNLILKCIRVVGSDVDWQLTSHSWRTTEPVIL
jgi:hypothetical protein